MQAGTGGYILVGVGTAVVVAAVVGGLMVLGSPAKERERRMDQRRIEQLAELGRAIDIHHARAGKLPSSLAEMEGERPLSITRDPGTQQSYEYRVLDTNRYELCAQFQQQGTRGGSEFWYHGAGRQCFTLTVREAIR